VPGSFLQLSNMIAVVDEKNDGHVLWQAPIGFFGLTHFTTMSLAHIFSLSLFFFIVIVAASQERRRIVETPFYNLSPSPTSTQFVRIPSKWQLHRRTDRTQNIRLTFALKQQNVDILEKLFWEVSDPRSPSYTHYLTRDQVRSLVKPKQSTVDTVLTWLLENGVLPSKISHQNDWLIADMPAAKAEELLQCEFYSFKHSETGDVIIRSKTLYSLPEHIADHVDFVGGVLHFPKQRKTFDLAALKKKESNSKLFDLQVTPNLLRERYKVGDAAGKVRNNSQSVVQFLGEYYEQIDLDEFFLLFYRPALGNAPMIVGYDGWLAGMEASLDIEYIMSIGANVPTQFWSVKDPENPNDDAFLKWMLIMDNYTHPPYVASVSYGEDESDLTPQYARRINVEFQKQGLRGISVLFASGDSGVGGSDFGCKRFNPGPVVLLIWCFWTAAN
jgi:tripeptidyl-peptidase-1